MRWFIPLLFAPALVLGALTGTDRGTGGNATSESTTFMNPGGTLVAGSTGFLLIAADNLFNATTNLPNSATDSAGNVWWKYSNKISANTALLGVEYATYISYLTTNLTSGGNVPIAYTTPVVAKCWSFIEMAPSGGKIALPSNDNTQTTSTATPSSTPNPTLPIGSAIIGVVGAQNASTTFTPVSDTTNGTWSTQQFTTAGSGTSGMAITSQWKVQTTAVSKQTYNPTPNASVSLAIAAILVLETDPKARMARGVSTGATTALTLSPAKTVSAGSMGVLFYATDNAGSGGSVKVCPDSITDSVGNLWTLRQSTIADPGAAGAGAEIGMYTAPITTNLTPADSITATWDFAANVAASRAFIWEFTPGGGNAFSFIASGGFNNSSAPTGTPTVTTGSVTSGDTVIGAGSAEGSNTWAADADTSNGNWSSMLVVDSGNNAASDITGMSQWKTVTGTATQTFNPTLTSADVVLAWLQIREASAAVTSTSKFLPFFP